MKLKNLSIYSFLFIGLVFAGEAAAQQQNNQTQPLGTIPALTKADCLKNAIGINIAAKKDKFPDRDISISKKISSTYQCPSTRPADAKTPDSKFFALDDNYNLILAPGFLLEDACTEEGKKSVYTYLCAYNGTNLAGRIDYSYDTTALKINLKEAIGGYKQVTLTIDNGGKNVENYEVCYEPRPIGPQTKDKNIFLEEAADCIADTDGWPQKKILSNSHPMIGDIENGQPYAFIVRAIDANKKALSVWSNALIATPTEAYSFTDIYEGEAPPIQFDCSQSATSASTMPLWGFLGLILLGLRRKKAAQLPNKILLVFLVLAANSASAHLGQLNLSINGTPYLPNIDASQKAGAIAPYQCMFDNALRPLMGLDLDVHLVDDFGSLQIGAGVAYTYASGMALAQANSCTAKSNSQVGMHLFHIKLPQLTYILSPWIKSVPIAPYIRAGLMAAGYVFTFQGKPDYDGTNQKNIKPIGITFGWEAAAGFMFLLDVFEPKSAGQARGMGTFNHTYLKAEVAYAPLNNFGRGGPDLSSAWPNKNLPLMLNFGLVLEFP